MSKKAKRSGGDPRKRARASLSVFGSLAMNQAFARQARANCSECGSARIEWTTAGALALQNAPEWAVAGAREIIPYYGADAEAWCCRDCGGAGFFEQELHVEGFDGIDLSGFTGR